MNLYDLITASKCKELKLKLKMTRSVEVCKKNKKTQQKTAFHEFRNHAMRK